MFQFNHRHQGAYYLGFAKVVSYQNNQLNYIVVDGSVVRLHILLGPYWCVCGALFGMRLIPNSAPQTHPYGPNKICSRTIEPTTTMYFNRLF